MKRLAGGVARFSGKLAGSVLGGVTQGVGCVAVGAFSFGGAARYALGSESDEEQDAGNNNERNVYEQRARVDQILFFFEHEFERYEHYFKDPEELERLRVEYYNCINAIEFQNELLAQLVDEVLDLRSQLRSGLLDQPPAGGPGSMAAIKAQGAARKELSIKLAHVKLDTGERKSKRKLKDRDRRALAVTLSPLLSDAKLQRLLEEQASDQREAEDLASWENSVRQGDAGRGKIANETEVKASEMEAHATSATISRRRYKQYSDAELTSLLCANDD